MSQEVSPEVPPWDGRGLPPVAAARVARAKESGVRTSLLSVSGAASLETVGLDPVGEVMGCCVENVGWQGYTGCGAPIGFGSSFGFGPQSTVVTRDSRWAAFRPYADAIRRGYGTAMARLLEEVAALGADGAVGIQLTLSNLGGAREFTALGTAVRARSTVRPARPFSTNLPGSEVAKLMGSGWVPASLLVGFEVAIRHDDWQTLGQAGSWSNVEVSGYTELTQQVRHAVRTDVQHQVRRLGADGFVASTIALRVFEIRPSEGHIDHAAEALMIGTALAQFRRQPSSSTRVPGAPASRRPTSLSVLGLSTLTPRRFRR